jgi:hypothetical protein
LTHDAFARELAALRADRTRRRRRLSVAALVITVLLAVSTAGVWAFVRLRDAREAEAARRIAFMDSDSLFEAAFASSQVSLTPWMWASIGETMTLQNEVRARGDAMLPTLAAHARSTDDGRRQFAAALLREIHTPAADDALADVDTGGLFIRHRIDIVRRICVSRRPGVAFRRLWADASTPSAELRAVIVLELRRMARERAPELRADGIAEFVEAQAIAKGTPVELREQAPEFRLLLEGRQNRSAAGSRK